jgi:hypothetical protein
LRDRFNRGRVAAFGVGKGEVLERGAGRVVNNGGGSVGVVQYGAVEL